MYIFTSFQVQLYPRAGLNLFVLCFLNNFYNNDEKLAILILKRSLLSLSLEEAHSFKSLKIYLIFKKSILEDPIYQSRVNFINTNRQHFKRQNMVFKCRNRCLTFMEFHKTFLVFVLILLASKMPKKRHFKYPKRGILNAKKRCFKCQKGAF